MSNYYIMKRLIRLSERDFKVQPSKLVPLSEYSERKSVGSHSPAPAASKNVEEEDKKNVYRSNLFAISKPFEDVNKDFKYNPDIRNAM